MSALIRDRTGRGRRSRAAAVGQSDYDVAGCTPADLGGRSVARVWDEALLELIRQVVPAPTVHARNLFHMSAAMWDAWAAYDADADGYLVTEKLATDDVAAAREAAISYAVYRLLLWRYGTVSDLPVTAEQLDAVMASLCYRTDFEATDGDSPAALGNRIAAAVIEYGGDDGALENERYVDSSYTPVNDPLVMSESGTVMRDPNRLAAVGARGADRPERAADPRQGADDHRPALGSRHVVRHAAVRGRGSRSIPVRRRDSAILPATRRSSRPPSTCSASAASSTRPTASRSTSDRAPSATTRLGTNDGDGHDVNPATGEPYEPNVVLRANYARTLAEFWADGPKSETPPGHWNVIANDVTDSPGFERRIGGVGEVLDPLEWDVKLYLALNGAVHDAAIAAWGLKGYYDSVRPISMIRYMGGLGQSSDPDGPSYDPEGLPLVDDLVEVVTEESSAPGERHEELADHVGEIAVRTWRGFPADPETETSGVGWILRRRLGALPAVDVRDAGVRRLRVRATARSAARPPRSWRRSPATPTSRAG